VRKPKGCLSLADERWRPKLRAPVVVSQGGSDHPWLAIRSFGCRIRRQYLRRLVDRREHQAPRTRKPRREIVTPIKVASSTDYGLTFGRLIELGRATMQMWVPGGANGVALPTIAADPDRDALYAAFVTGQRQAGPREWSSRYLGTADAAGASPFRHAGAARRLLRPAAARRRRRGPSRRLRVRVREGASQRRPRDLPTQPAPVRCAATYRRSVVQRCAWEPAGRLQARCMVDRRLPGTRVERTWNVSSLLERHANREPQAVRDDSARDVIAEACRLSGRLHSLRR
jgi:hypothetical protein